MSLAHVYTIPPTVSFVDALAAELLRRADGDPQALARMQILLPTRRAARALTLAFLRHSRQAALLLPRFTPLADVDEDELLFAASDAEPPLGADADDDVPEAIAPLRRLLLLTRLVRRRLGPAVPVEQAARLAGELARLLDQVHTEQLDLAALPSLVPDELARHWQATVSFLSLLTEAWPKLLASEGCLDPAERRNRLLAAQAERWHRSPPADPVIAAGSTGSIPATAHLLARVARLPTGCVVLPGLDRAADDATWSAILQEPGHPQYGMAQLLQRIGLSRHDVADWPCDGLTATPAARLSLIHRALRPAAVAHPPTPAAAPDSGATDPDHATVDEAMAGVVRIDTATAEEEARVIALILRHALEQPQQTAALVTPDRALARRATSELQRWGIAIDDSAGTPLSHTGPGLFFRLVAAMVVGNFAPIPLLAALKHPLAAAGQPPSGFRSAVRTLERAVLRGPRPAPGISGLRAALSDSGPTRARQLIDDLDAATADFHRLVAGEEIPLAYLLQAHVTSAERLAETDQSVARLWAGDAGEALADLVRDVLAAVDDSDRIDPVSYPSLIDVLMQGRVVRPAYGRHPRLAVWGPLEARLQRADVLILSGLNEDTWPPKAPASPWMSRPMMQRFGLQLPERRIGLSAHDFVQGFCAPRVYLTRSLRQEGSPTVPCRWLLRLDTALAATGWPASNAAAAARWLHWQEQLDDTPGARPVIAAPRACPPLAARPRRLSVTKVETWMRDPYAIYAEYVLRLKALQPIDADPSAADFGSAVHRALDAFIRDAPAAETADQALGRLLACGRAAFAEQLDHPVVRRLSWPRFEQMARWFVAAETERRAQLGIRASFTEIEGELHLDAPAGPFRLTAKADRIDLLADNSLAIVDYKTGSVPKPKEINAGYAPQLPLEAAIAAKGGFAGLAATEVSMLEYIRLRGNASGGERIQPKADAGQLAGAALRRLEQLVALFDDANTAYEARPRAAVAPRFSDYEHLERLAEWASVMEDDA